MLPAAFSRVGSQHWPNGTKHCNASMAQFGTRKRKG